MRSNCVKIAMHRDKDKVLLSNISSRPQNSTLTVECVLCIDRPTFLRSHLFTAAVMKLQQKAQRLVLRVVSVWSGKQQSRRKKPDRVRSIEVDKVVTAHVTNMAHHRSISTEIYQVLHSEYGII